MRNEIENKHFMLGQMYGKHLPMQIRMECDILSQVQRLPGLPNSNLGLETILGRDETIDFEDYLGGARAEAARPSPACPSARRSGYALDAERSACRAAAAAGLP